VLCSGRYILPADFGQRGNVRPRPKQPETAGKEKPLSAVVALRGCQDPIIFARSRAVLYSSLV
jgi:hypothetical protein